MKAAEKGIVWLLGLLLATWGWQDLATYAHRPAGPKPAFDFLQASSHGERVGEAELFFRLQAFVSIEGLSRVETAYGRGAFRQALGPATRLTVRSENAKVAVFSMGFHSAVAGQNLTVRYDGQTLETLTDLNQDAVERTYRLPLGPGEHVFSLEYTLWNGHGAELSKTDSRPIAGSFARAELDFEE